MTLEDQIGSIAAPVLFIGLLLVVARLQQRSTEKLCAEMRALSGSNRIDFYDQQLPPDLPEALLRRLSRKPLSVSRCFSGTIDGERVVVFRYARGSSARRGGWYTVIAVKQAHPERDPSPRYGRVAARAGNWVMISGSAPWQFGWLFSPRRIFEDWNSLLTTSETEREALARAQETKQDVVIRPRRSAGEDRR